MKPSIDLAKNEGLNWQALVIEDAETEIKRTISQGYLDDASLKMLRIRVERIIRACIDDLEDEEMKKLADRGLRRLAGRCYLTAQRGLNKYSHAFIVAMATILTPKATIQAKRKAYRNAEKSFIKVNDRRIGVSQIYEPSERVYFRDITTPLNKYMKEYMEDVKETFFEIAGTSAKDGDLSLRAISEMRVRQQRHIEELFDLTSRGVSLVWIDSHANCSERCEPWQGKLYSLDGSTGEIDGIKYVPLEKATDHYTITKAGKTYKNGCISGFNCRHRLLPYEGRHSRPQQVPAEIVEKERNVNNTQRAMERKVRLYRERAMVMKGIDNVEYEKWRALAIKANEEYIAYSRENLVAYYPSRTNVFETEEYIRRKLVAQNDSMLLEKSREALTKEIRKARDLRSLLGKEFTGVKGQSAINKLLEERRGHVKGAFHRDDVGDIDLFWGTPTVGLQHIILQRQKQGINIKDFLSDISDVIENGEHSRTTPRGDFEIKKDTKIAVIGRTYHDNKWEYLLTAYNTKKSRH